MGVTCLQCRDYQYKLNAREEQIRWMVDTMRRILIAANDVLQDRSDFSDREVLLAIADEASKF